MPAAATKKATTTRKVSSHPTFLNMIQEAVLAHPEDVRAGVSRPTIKKFLANKYKIDLSSASNINNLSNAIKRGAETGALVLPKGPGGRIKLPPKAKKAAPAAGKENVAPKKPAAKPAAKKAAAKPAAKKAAAKPATKKATTAAATTKKAAPAKKASSTTKKAPAAKAAATKKAAPAKKAAPKKAAAKK